MRLDIGFDCNYHVICIFVIYGQERSDTLDNFIFLLLTFQLLFLSGTTTKPGKLCTFVVFLKPTLFLITLVLPQENDGKCSVVMRDLVKGLYE